MPCFPDVPVRFQRGYRRLTVEMRFVRSSAYQHLIIVAVSELGLATREAA